MEQFISELRRLLSQDCLEKCVESLEMKLARNSSLRNEIYLTLGRLASLKRKIVHQEISDNDALVERNKIRTAILSLIERLEAKDFNDSLGLERTPLQVTDRFRYPFYSFQGLKAGSFSHIMKEAIQHLEKATFLRVIGSARQDMLALRRLPLMEKYLKVIEAKMLKHDAERPFFYRRITTQHIKPKFLEHLEACFEISRANGNDIQVVLEQNIDLSITYFIIDSSMIVLNLYTTVDLGVKDNTLLFSSTDQEIIRLFAKHFTEAWSSADANELVIKSIERFQEVIPVHEEIYEKLNQMRCSLRAIPNKSIRMDHVHREIEQATSRIIGLSKYHLSVEHKLANGKLLSVFYRYINDLRAGGNYKTISFFEFWDNLSDLDTFIIAHENALVRSAKIIRLYLVDNLKLDNSNYIAKQRKIIQRNLQLAKKYKNYRFKILFSDTYEDLLQLYENFAIWEQGEEKIVFFPGHENPAYPIGKTNLYFINDRDSSHKNYRKNRARYERASEILSKRLKEWEFQAEHYSEAQKLFLQETTGYST